MVKKMEEELRVVKRNERRVPIYSVGLLSTILIATFIFTLKNYEPARNIILTGGIIIYPFSFLILALISKYYGFKEARRSVFVSSLIYILFIVIMVIGILPLSNVETSTYSSLVQFIFAKESFIVGDFIIYYPILSLFFSVLISYVVSHLLFATIYNAVSKYTIDYLAVGLSLFIAYILDRLLFMPILFVDDLISGNKTFDYLIKCLTSEFIAAIMITILLIIIYIIYTTIKNAITKN